MGKVRQRLFTTCATAIVMGSLAGLMPVGAQGGFLGNVTGSVGGPSIFRGGMDVIEVNNPETIIDWRPNDQVGTGTIDYLPAGNSALFRNNANAQITDFTVLNRIQPIDATTGLNTARVIAFNGTVQSQINGQPGGKVWFYTPGGIVVGSTGVFDVGSLILTSNAIDTTGGLYGANNTIRFRGTAGSTAGVTINSGAQITASATNSYVALVAPSVVQGGNVSVNGSTAYVGAEQADIRINGGLFDIAVTVGTTDANGVQHSGTTTGAASQNFPPLSPDPQRIFLVAVPKNQALTMLLSGNLGYPAAASVFQENSAVVLSAGRDIENGAVVAASSGTGSAAIAIGPTTFSSRVDGAAVSDITLTGPGLIRFTGDATLNADTSINLLADPGTTIDAQAAMNLNAGNGTTGGTITLRAVGGAVSVAPGTISVAGQLAIDASGNGNGIVPDATGGTVSVTADASAITTGSLFVNATANSNRDNSRSGNATGGAITLATANAGALTLGNVSLYVSGNSLFSITPPTSGGDAQGGTIRLTAPSGTTTLGVIQLRAQATGGTSTTGTAGRATAGDIYIDVAGGTHNWTSLFADVSTAEGFSSNGGTLRGAFPGVNGISLDVRDGATVAIAQSVSLYGETSATGYGGPSPASVQGSPVTTRVRNGGSLTITNDFYVTTEAQSYPTLLNSGSSNSSDVFAGAISLSAEGGSFSAGSLSLYADARGLFGGISGGNATAGSITLFSSAAGGTRGDLSLTDCANAICTLSATGSGGASANGSNGTGGTILVYASDAELTLPDSFSINTTGRAGGGIDFDNLPAPSGNGFGGNITIQSRFGQQNSAVMTFGNLTAAATGSATPLSEGAYYNQGDGGFGLGGTTSINVFGGQLNATTIALSATGIGGASNFNCPSCGTGSGDTAFQAGPGQGGTASFVLGGGSATIGSLDIQASGSGGDAQSGNGPNTLNAIAGAGRGGTATFQAQSGSITLDTLQLGAQGTGGTGYGAVDTVGASGDAGTGGTTSFILDFGSSATVNVTTLNLSATGLGGNGGSTEISDYNDPYRAGSGGGGNGGTVDFLVAGGTLNAGSIALSATGAGGRGGDNQGNGDAGDAGDGTGGTARLNFSSEGHSINALSISTVGSGGQAGSAQTYVGLGPNDEPLYDYGPGAGGNGGTGTGGTSGFTLDVDPVFGDFTIDASGIGSIGGTGATGGAGGNGFGGSGGAGAMLSVNFGTLTVTNQLKLASDGIGGDGGVGITGRGGIGGIGTGGEAGMTITGATTLVQTGQMLITADGFGGVGGLGGLQGGDGITGANGGAAFGGAAGINVTDNATFELGSSTIIRARASGGDGAVGTASIVVGNGGSGGAGGAATGGRARFAMENANLRDTADGTITINADATGGAGALGLADGGLGGRGGDATGGLAQLEGASGSTSLYDVAIQARGFGGRGGDGATGADGGIATGGTASANWFDFVGNISPFAALVSLESLDTSADAVGGAGGTGNISLGGTGGEAIGGTSAVGIDGATDARLSGLAIHALSTGGNGGASRGTGITGATGGRATGGRVRFDATGGSTTTFPGSVTLIADAIGGAGAGGVSGPTGGNGGDGGIATGGDARFTITAAQVTGFGNGLSLSAQGTGGNAGSGGDGSATGVTGGAGGTGGTGTGGLAQFSTTTADFSLPDLVMDVSGSGGEGGEGGIGPGFPGNPSAIPPVPPTGPIQSGRGFGGFATGGTALLLNSDNGTIGAGAERSLTNVSIIANGNYSNTGISGGTQGGSIVITDSSSAANGGLSIFNGLFANAYGGSCACAGITLSSLRNAIHTNYTSLNTDSALTFTFSRNGTLRSDFGMDGYGGTSIVMTQDSVTSALTSGLDAGRISLFSFGNITINGFARIRTVNDIDIRSAGGTVDVAKATAGTTISLVSDNGFVGLGTADAGDSITVDAGTNLIANYLTTTTGDIVLTSRAGQAQLGDSSAGRDFIATANGDGLIQFGTTRAGRDLTFTGDSYVTAGTLIVGDDLTLNARAGLASLQNGTTTGATASDGSILTVTGSGGAVAFNATSADDIIITGGTDAYISTQAIAGRDIRVTAQNGNAFLNTLTAGGVIDATASENVSLGSGTSTGALRLNAMNGAVSGGVLSGGSISATGNQGVGLAQVTSASTTSLLSANGVIDLPDLTSAGLVSASGQSVTIGGTGMLSFSSVTATNGAITLNAAAINADSLTATGDILIDTSGGNAALTTANAGGILDVATIDGALSGGTLSGSSVTLSGDRGIAFTQVTSAGTTSLIADTGAIALPSLTSAGLITASGQSVIITGGGALSFNGTAASSGPITLTAGTLSANGLTSTGAIALTSTSGALSAGTLSGTDLILTSAGDASLDGPVTIGNALRVTASGQAAVNSGTVSAQTIDIASRDIVIGTGAQLGVQGQTTGLSLTNSDNQRQTFIGGDSVSGSYSLSSAEIAQMFSGNITISAQRVSSVQSAAFGTSRAPDVSVRDFTVTAGASSNLGANGTFAINTPGKVRVQGAVRFTGLGTQGGLTIAAQEATEVVAGSGLIDLQGAGNAPGGVLQITSADVIVATLDAMDAVSTATTLDARNDRLAQNDGVVVDGGSLRAGAIRLAVSGGAYIQNSGATTEFADRRGFTAGSFRVDGANANTQIVLNGRLVDGQGVFTSGVAAIPLLSINGIAGGQTGQYADRSTLNGCLIGNTASCGTIIVIPPVVVTPTPDNRDSIDEILDPTVAVAQIFPVTIVQLRDFVAEGYPPLIDEPVTGAGNEDLWDSNCSVSREDGCADPVAP